jgi:uncharacterized OB-fold protein
VTATARHDDELRPQPPGIPVPVPSPIAAPFWDGCRHGELRFQRCEGCGTAVFNPSPVCPACRGRRLAWEASAGRGRLYTWTVVWRPQTPAFRTPYAPAVVDVDEGFRLVTAIVGCRPGDLRAGMALAVSFHPAGDGVVLPYFRPSA